MALANRKVNRKTRRTNRKRSGRAKRRGLAFASRKRRATRRSTRRNRRRASRRQRGGDYLEATSRPFFASVYPNTMQTAYSTWTGAQPNNYPADPRPEAATWSYASNGTPLSPNMITRINTDFNLMAGPTAYNPTALVTDGAGVNAGSAVVSGAAGSSSGAGFVTGAGAGAGAGSQTSIASNMALGQQSNQSFTL